MKKFIIIGNNNSLTIKEIFPYIKEGKVWLGVTSPKDFIQLNNEIKKFGNILWFTNIEHQITGKPVQLTKSYYDNPEYYPKYDNYDAINVDRIKDIPIDYDGVMGVPITFLDKYFNSEFEIIDGREIALNDKCRNKSTYLIKDADSAINGKPTYARVLIKKKLEFEIIGLSNNVRYIGDFPCLTIINGKKVYNRILIKKLS